MRPPAYVPLLVPFAVEAAWLILFAGLARYVYPHLSPDRASSPTEEQSAKKPYIDEKGQPMGKAAWVRWLELGFIVYHFPLIVPACWISKNNTSPRWVYWLTPVVYSAILYLLWLRR